VKCQVADVTELKLGSSSTNVIFSNWLLMYLSDEECAKLTRDILHWVRAKTYIPIAHSPRLPMISGTGCVPKYIFLSLPHPSRLQRNYTPTPHRFLLNQPLPQIGPLFPCVRLFIGSKLRIHWLNSDCLPLGTLSIRLSLCQSAFCFASHLCCLAYQSWHSEISLAFNAMWPTVSLLTSDISFASKHSVAWFIAPGIGEQLVLSTQCGLVYHS
jgi:hypothetical protein